MTTPSTPSSRFGYVPALDGLRALSVVAVLLFHGGAPFARGGYTGVTVFFTLSGFLITTVALRPVIDGGDLALGGFWARRFRRLAPASLLCLGGSAIVWSTMGLLDDSTQSDIRAATLQVANWWFIHVGHGYGDTFGTPSPVEHFWSLAIEEQFYLVFPLAIVGATALARRRGWQVTRVVGIGAVVMGVVSLGLTVAPWSADRVYFGTDTRAVELLIGVALAVWCGPIAQANAANSPAPGGVGRPSRIPVELRATAARIGVHASAARGALVALALIGWVVAIGWMRLDGPMGIRGGLPLVAVAAAVLINGAMRPGWLSTAMAWRPLVAIGTVSYGAYLYHWPVFAILDPVRVGVGGIGLFALRVAVTAVITVASYRWIEQPVRRGEWPDRERAGAVLAVGIATVLVVTTALPVTDSVKDAVADAKSSPVSLGLIEPPTTESANAALDSTVDLTTTPHSDAMTIEQQPSDTLSTADTSSPPATSDTSAAVPAVPPASPPNTSPAPVPGPIVAFAGDSVPWLLSQAIAPIQDEWGARIMNLAVEACDGARGYPEFRYGSGDEATEPEQCTPYDTTWPSVFRQFGEPAAVVIMVGAVAVMDRKIDGRWTDACQPDFATWYRAETAARIDWLRTQTNAVIVLPTVPWPDPVSKNFGVPADSVRRTDCLNTILGEVAAARPEVVRPNLAGFVCPGAPGQCAPYRQDGLHYIGTAARSVGRWLMPQVLAATSR